MSNSFRPYLLSLSLLIGVVLPCAVTAQAPISNIGSGSVDDRVTQLERISNAHSQLLTQLQQQFADNQRDIDLLRGQIQENQYQLSQVVERQKQIYQQMDSFSGQSPAASQDGQSQAFTPTDGDSQGVTPAANTVISDIGDANTDYNEAVALVLEKKQYEQAISAFRNFVERYPDSTYQPNANYWLGQLNYNQGRKNDALYYFALVAKTYPKSHKAPDALLKVGVIMQEKGQKDKARAVYQQVGKLYPSAEAAKQARKRLAAL
ncbi:MAG: Cell division coordinator CpoB [Sodalis sp.]|uniref:cell division protein CpoB n=1 Tax=Sodalis sp. (in: enterobacteria) TaxID=1898979 RepID=UPI003873C9B0|nr:MAG: Cell division coordinator CpoB [Sodalis sp.]